MLERRWPIMAGWANFVCGCDADNVVPLRRGVIRLSELRRAIAIRQPFAWAVIYGGKDVENRGASARRLFKSAVGERVLISRQRRNDLRRIRERGGFHGQHRRPVPPAQGAAVRRRDRLGFRERHRHPQRQPVVPKGRDRSCVRRRTARAVRAGARPDRPLPSLVAMIRIAISVEAFEAIAKTLPVGSVGFSKVVPMPLGARRERG
jgi:hypothetical protein